METAIVSSRSAYGGKCGLVLVRSSDTGIKACHGLIGKKDALDVKLCRAAIKKTTKGNVKTCGTDSHTKKWTFPEGEKELYMIPTQGRKGRGGRALVSAVPPVFAGMWIGASELPSESEEVAKSGVKTTADWVEWIKETRAANEEDDAKEELMENGLTEEED